MDTKQERPTTEVAFTSDVQIAFNLEILAKLARVKQSLIEAEESRENILNYLVFTIRKLLYTREYYLRLQANERLSALAHFDNMADRVIFLYRIKETLVKEDIDLLVQDPDRLVVQFLLENFQLKAEHIAAIRDRCRPTDWITLINRINQTRINTPALMVRRDLDLELEFIQETLQISLTDLKRLNEYEREQLSQCMAVLDTGVNYLNRVQVPHMNELPGWFSERCFELQMINNYAELEKAIILEQQEGYPEYDIYAPAWFDYALNLVKEQHTGVLFLFSSLGMLQASEETGGKRPDLEGALAAFNFFYKELRQINPVDAGLEVGKIVASSEGVIGRVEQLQREIAAGMHFSSQEVAAMHEEVRRYMSAKGLTPDPESSLQNNFKYGFLLIALLVTRLKKD